MVGRARRRDEWRDTSTRVAMRATTTTTATTATARRGAHRARVWVVRACGSCDASRARAWTSSSARARASCGSSARGVLRESASGADAPLATGTIDAKDARFMRRALEVAATATGEEVFPNPLVGCVVVDARTDDVVGEGYHPKAGEPHAEVFALRAAGELARGATAYVTLEPCNHFGRTPPCARALVDAGVARVVVGFVDPDPRVSGGGIQTLVNAGIEVAVGCEEEACREINADFIERQLALRDAQK